MRFELTTERIRHDLDALGQLDEAFQHAIEQVGYPTERRGDAGFCTFVKIVVGQQLSTKAASTINGRLDNLLEGLVTPERYLSLTEKDLEGVGLSRQKKRYLEGLCEAVASGVFDPEALPHLSDEDAIKSITSLLGFGAWSAHMYLMFSLGRTDIWPVDDLAVQEAVRRFKRLKKRPKPKEMEKIAKKWRPYRSAAAIFFWHYYKNVPDI